MSCVAAFLGGMLFAFVVSAGALWWMGRGAPPVDQCPECDGTGLRLPS